MNRQEKQQFIDEMHEKLGKAEAALVVTFSGLNVAQATDLRAKFREAGVEYRVVKNTLAKIALKDTDKEPLEEHFTGPNAVILGYDDVVAPAKILAEFLKDDEVKDKIQIKGGVVQGKAVGVDGIEALAKMPGLDELRAKLAALINTPATNLVRLLGTPGTQLAQVLKAKSEKADA
ncbi:MAG: 50S ribosomal protein L10 [Deltaproteobacteria bacterium]|nr:MAG: 50S ribosomal protein L10 [Deltaproteobacteria bacterium]